jgi:pyridoxamine 5'-phosphate oxidase
VWSLLANGVRSHKAPFHYGQICSFGNEYPESRTVIIRAVDKEHHKILFNTDIRGIKISQFENNNKISWHFYIEALRVQMRLYGTIYVHYENDLTEAAWQATRTESKLSYSTLQKPGSLLHEPELILMQSENVAEETIAFAKNNFAIAETTIDAMDVVLLNHKGNKRAYYNYLQKIMSWKQV